MFTGIVEEVGKIVNVKKGAQSLLLTIGGNTIFDDLKIGDSVAVNGVLFNCHIYWKSPIYCRCYARVNKYDDIYQFKGKSTR